MEQEQKLSLDFIPNDLKIFIMTFLDADSLVNLAATAKSYHKLLSNSFSNKNFAQLKIPQLLEIAADLPIYRGFLFSLLEENKNPVKDKIDVEQAINYLKTKIEEDVRKYNTFFKKISAATPTYFKNKKKLNQQQVSLSAWTVIPTNIKYHYYDNLKPIVSITRTILLHLIVAALAYAMFLTVKLIQDPPLKSQSLVNSYMAAAKKSLNYMTPIYVSGSTLAFNFIIKLFGEIIDATKQQIQDCKTHLENKSKFQKNITNCINDIKNSLKDQKISISKVIGNFERFYKHQQNLISLLKELVESELIAFDNFPLLGKEEKELINDLRKFLKEVEPKKWEEKLNKNKQRVQSSVYIPINEDSDQSEDSDLEQPLSHSR